MSKPNISDEEVVWEDFMEQPSKYLTKIAVDLGFVAVQLILSLVLMILGAGLPYSIGGGAVLFIGASFLLASIWKILGWRGKLLYMTEGGRSSTEGGDRYKSNE